MLCRAPPFFMAFHKTEASAILMRFRPSSTLSANLIASGSVERFSVVHWQKDAISAALSTESFESLKPDSMIEIRPAAALRRLSSGVARGICFDIPSFYLGAPQPNRGSLVHRGMSLKETRVSLCC